METKLMALAALKKIAESSPAEDGCYYTNRSNISIARAAVPALEADIARPVEPVGGMAVVDGEVDDFECYPGVTLTDGEYSLYTTPQEPALKPFDEAALYRAAISCGHVIEHHCITLERDETKPGNALNQLQQRLNKAACEMAQQEPAAAELLAALTAMTDKYVGLVNSGDAGNWDPEKDAEVVSARSAILKAQGGAA